MSRIALAAALFLANLAVNAPAIAAPLAPGEIVAAAPASDWIAIPASDLLVMDLAPDAALHPRRVVIQLLPQPFSQGWIGNIRKLAAAHWWDGTSINRAQDNYVVQWGDPDGEDKVRAKPLPPGLLEVPQGAYSSLAVTPVPIRDPKSGWANALEDAYGFGQFYKGWPLGREGVLPAGEDRNWPIHCYGMVGVGRDMPPDTGTGAELYAVIGQAPRQLDRNIALVGRVIEGMEHLSTLPRGTGDIGFYKTAAERVPIVSIRSGADVTALPAFEYLSTESASFARYAEARANRRDAFFVRPAGGVDICNIPVPIRHRP
jgi:peptidylprolyl isomerase